MSVADVDWNATYSGGSVPTGFGVICGGVRLAPNGVVVGLMVGTGVGVDVAIGVGMLPGAGLLRSRSAIAS
jgi:hypothetical protein